MNRTGALLSSVLTALRYRKCNGRIIMNTPIRFAAIAASANAPTPGTAAESQKPEAKKPEGTDPTGSPVDRPIPSGEAPRQLRYGTLQFLLQRKMPVNSVRLLTSGVRLACDERKADDLVPYLGAWSAQLTRPDNLERIMPWVISDILRDLTRLTKIVGARTVRDALPPKHLQTLANRLVVQGFDKLTPLQLARAATSFADLRPFISRAAFDQAAIDAGDASAPAAAPWPTSDWVDELVDWIHNLKPNVEPWQRTSCYILSVILLGLARSNYKPRQPTFQAAATAMKAKLEEQQKSGYLSRSALANSAMAWNIWRVNPEEYAAGYWDVYLKSAAQLMEEYVDTAPDPPSVEDDLAVQAEGEEEGEGVGRRQRPRFTPSLLMKRREFRSLLATVIMAARNFNLIKQFDEIVKPIWERRVDEHAQYISAVNARRIVNSCDGLGLSLKPQTKDKLMAAASVRKRQNFGGAEDRDVDDFDDLRGSTKTRASTSATAGRGGARAMGRNEVFDDYDDFNAAGGSIGSGKIQKTERGGGKARRDDDFAFDDKPF